MKLKGKIISCILVICFVFEFIPAVSVASDSRKSIMFGAQGLHGYNSTDGYDYIYYGKKDGTLIKWRVLSDKTNTGSSDGLFLLSENIFDKNSVKFNNNSSDGNAYQGSNAQRWCMDFANGNLSTQESDAIIETSISDSAFNVNCYSYLASDNILNHDKVFFLSAQEASSADYGFVDDLSRIVSATSSFFDGVSWWLRSPYYINGEKAGDVYSDGTVERECVNATFAARPAFNLNRDSVLFTSAAEGGKIPAAESGGKYGAEGADAIFKIEDYDGADWKLTLKDENRSFNAEKKSESGGTVTLSYENAVTDDDEYISVIIADKENEEAMYYGRVAAVDNAEGEISFDIPEDLEVGEYTLNVFNEHYEADDATDYASRFVEFDFKVDAVPVLTAGSVSRDSETNATVKFTSNEEGTYYYKVVDKDSEVPDIDTTGEGTSCDTTEQTISLSDIVGSGAKDIYIVVKNEAGNESEPLKIEIPEYIAPSTPFQPIAWQYLEPTEKATNPDQDKKNPNTVIDNPFSDVKKSDWFFDGVLFVYNKGIMTGTSDTTFNPYGKVTRGMMATIFYRKEGKPAVTGAIPYSDVESGKYYTEAVNWAMQNGIFKGYDDNTFRAEENITREQLASAFYRYAKYKGDDLTPKGDLDKFTDKGKISVWAKESMQWALGSGLMFGKDNNMLAPHDTATRAEIAACVRRVSLPLGLMF